MREKPVPPGEYDCCESGCDPCVWDIYHAALRQWQAEQAAEPSLPPSAAGGDEDEPN